MFQVIKRNIILINLTIALLVFSVFVYFNGQKIAGPFIFGDELEYFSFARNIFYGKDLTVHRQYGILYPFICSFFFLFNNFEITYWVMRAFNILLIVSTVIPVFFLVKDWFNHRLLYLLLPLMAVITPFSGFVYLIWGEPLYYLLFYWFVYLFYRTMKRPTPILSTLTGCFLGGLFVLKPGAGFVVVAASYMTMGWYLLAIEKDKRGALLGSFFLLFLSSFVCAMPWAYRNLSLGLGFLGYKSHSDELSLMVAEFGWSKLIYNIIASLFYQISYVIIGSYGLVISSFVVFFKKCRSFPREELSVMVLTLFVTLGLIALSAFGMSTHHQTTFWYPNGRYYAIILPLIICVSLKFLLKISEKKERRLVYLISGGAFFVSLLASPLLALSPLSIVNNSELSLPMWIINKGLIVWRGKYDPTVLERVLYGLSILGFVWSAIWLTRWKRAVLSCIGLLCLICFTNSYFSHYYVSRLGETQNQLNSEIKTFIRQSKLTPAITIDAELQHTNVNHLIRFWSPYRQYYYVKLTENSNPEIFCVKSGLLVTKNAQALPKKYQFTAFDIYSLDDQFAEKGMDGANNRN